MYINMREKLENAWNFFLDLLFPEKCAICKCAGARLCANCASLLPRPDRYDLENIYAIFPYHDKNIKKLLHDLKYYRKRALGKMFGKFLYEFLKEEISEIQMLSSGAKIILIPVPINKSRIKKRGYNQALEIAKGMICEETKDIFEIRTDLVAKHIATTPQARIKKRNERLVNVVGTFRLLNTQALKGRSVIVVDDITTTGGTLNEIMKLLKNTGAKKVVGFAVAH